jgi:hypothetical protein
MRLPFIALIRRIWLRLAAMTVLSDVSPARAETVQLKTAMGQHLARDRSKFARSVMTVTEQ